MFTPVQRQAAALGRGAIQAAGSAPSRPGFGTIGTRSQESSTNKRE
jgi:hypothetical protein